MDFIWYLDIGLFIQFQRELIGLLLEEVEVSSPHLSNFGDLICSLVSAQASLKGEGFLLFSILSFYCILVY